jgi:hypothetical protein
MAFGIFSVVLAELVDVLVLAEEKSPLFVDVVTGCVWSGIGDACADGRG